MASKFNPDQAAFHALCELIKIRPGPFAYIVGAGLSRPANMPLWKDLKVMLLQEAERVANSADAEEAKRVRGLAQAAAYTRSPWEAFGHIREAIGMTSFRAAIRKVFEPSTSVAVPTMYGTLAKTRPTAVLSLNIDQFAQRAFVNAVHPTPAFFAGIDAGDRISLFARQQTFVAQLHGQLDSEKSWVLTDRDFKALKANGGYCHFMNVCASTQTLIMVGVTADDQAIGGFLDDLLAKGVSLPNHYWVTHRNDQDTKRWAEERSIRLVLYEADGDDHSALDQVITTMASFIPQEVPPVPVVADLAGTITKRVDVAELRGKSTDEVRLCLNGMAATILSEIADRHRSRDSYEDFLEEYDEAIHQAWYLSDKAGKNKLFGYTLHEKIGGGGFGTVYRATTPQGEPCAVKVLSNEVRRSQEMLDSFRRGVQAMRILSAEGVEGMVAYQHASEIPACAVMELVDGLNLYEVKNAQMLEDWSDILWAASQLVHIVRKAHVLPQRVLHRDIRPENAMIRNAHGARSDWELVVLDFDLCWHKDAEGLSVQTQNAQNGFVAPELVNRRPGVSTRSAAVDSFGLGMTLYFLRSGVSPRAGEHRAGDWRQRVEQCCDARRSVHWLSLPRRFARLILGATAEQQETRIDLSVIEAELAALHACEDAPSKVTSAEMIAEEIAARADSLRKYIWNEDERCAESVIPAGFTIHLAGEEATSTIRWELAWEAVGSEDRSGLKKYVGSRVDKASAILSRNSWRVECGARGPDRVAMTAWTNVSSVASDLNKAAKVLDEVAESFVFA